MSETLNFPLVRLRRLRRNPAIREMVQETSLRVADLVAPILINDLPTEQRVVLDSVPEVYHQSIDASLAVIEQGLDLGISRFLLLPVPDERDGEATGSWADHGLISQALQRIRLEFGEEAVLMTETRLNPFFSHGANGILLDGVILNDPTLELVAKVGLCHAAAGADFIVANNSLDGEVLTLRQTLDEGGFQDVGIIANGARFETAYDRPLELSLEQIPTRGDSESSRVHWANRREALEEVGQDCQEGADMIMVHPAMSQMDLINQLRPLTQLPIMASCGVGEYAMIKAAALQGWMDERQTVIETLTGIRRAGADMILTFSAYDAARWIQLPETVFTLPGYGETVEEPELDDDGEEENGSAE